MGTFTVLTLPQQSLSQRWVHPEYSICTLDYPITTCVKALLTRSLSCSRWDGEGGSYETLLYS